MKDFGCLSMKQMTILSQHFARSTIIISVADPGFPRGLHQTPEGLYQPFIWQQFGLKERVDAPSSHGFANEYDVMMSFDWRDWKPLSCRVDCSC